MNETHALTPHGASACRFLANLFLHPLSICAIVEYWLRNYEPLAVDTGAKAPATLSVGDFYHTLLSRVLAGVDDILLVGQGNMATAADTGHPRYQHYLNFVRPSAGDFTLGLPVRYLLREAPHIALALLPLYYEAEHFWRARSHGTLMGEHFFAHFHIDSDAVRWRDLFPREAFALEIVSRVLAPFSHYLPSEWISSEAIPVIDRMLDAMQRHSRLSTYVGDMRRILRNSQSVFDKISACRVLTYTYRRESHETIMRLYSDIATCLDMGVNLDDAVTLPWNRNILPLESNRHVMQLLSHARDSTQKEEKEENEDEDAMDIDTIVTT
jgi:hypothetical protein